MKKPIADPRNTTGRMPPGVEATRRTAASVHGPNRCFITNPIPFRVPMRRSRPEHVRQALVITRPLRKMTNYSLLMQHAG